MLMTTTRGRSVRALGVLVALAWIGVLPVPSRAAGPVTLRFQDWRLAEEPAGPSLTRMLEAFGKANPDIKVEPEPVSVRDKVQKFVTQARGGNPPDVVRVLTTDVPSFQAMGALADLEGFVGKAGGQSYKDQYSAFLVNAATFGGKLYCMPNEGDAFVLYINARLWREAGLDPEKPPTTFADLEKANRALAKPGSGRYAFGMLAEPAIAAIWMQSWFTAHGADFFNPTYTDTLIDSPQGIEAFKFYTAMYTRDKAVPPGPTEVDYATQVNLFAQEKVAYIQGPFATKGGILAANPQLASVLRAIPFPGTKATAGRGTVYCLTKASKNPEAAWKLIEWLNSEDNQLRFFREATMMPTRKTALGKINVDTDPIARVMIREAIPAAKSYPVVVGWPKAKTVLDDALASTLLGRQDPETAMKNAAREIRAILGAK